MNRELAATILKKIERSPKNFSMDYFVQADGTPFAAVTTDPTEYDCDTTMCVAGWAEFLTNGSIVSGGPFASTRGREALDISREFADWLFYMDALADYEEYQDGGSGGDYVNDAAKYALSLMAAGCSEIEIVEVVRTRYPEIMPAYLGN